MWLTDQFDKTAGEDGRAMQAAMRLAGRFGRQRIITASRVIGNVAGGGGMARRTA
ncbi:MAG: hypothetical protein LBL83_06370 [Clostridiales bacterium]|jgi:hypothetical protein|nr:hypothetical protein [Clostridiales bacterium]